MQIESERGKTRKSIGGAALLFGGGILLILLGLVFQIGEFGYERSLAHDFWFFSMFLTNLWNMLALHMNVPGPQQVGRLLPVTLEAMGVAMVMLRRNIAGRMQEGDSHDE
ncbi:MAG: hypothetical protein ACRD4M_09845 [Candidatus Acidiferrales bacterium]